MERTRSSSRKRNHAAIDVDGDVGTSAKSVKNTHNNGVSGADTGGTRKPFSDLTNFDIIPTETLRKLCSNSLSASEAHPILSKAGYQRFLSPQLASNSKHRTVSDSDSRPTTSIDSSNVNTAPSIQPENSTPVPRSRSSKGLNPIGSIGNKGVISSHPRVVENLDGPRKIGVSLSAPTSSKKTQKQEKATHVLTSSEKAKDKGEAIAVPLDSTPTGIVSGKGKAIAVPLDSTPTGIVSDKGKAIAVPVDSISTGVVRDKGKAIAVPFDSTPNVIVRDKRKAIAVPFDSTPTVIVRDQRKTIAVPFDSTPTVTVRDKRKAIAVPFDSSPTVIVRDKGKAIAVNLSSSTVEKTSDKGKAVDVPFNSTLGENRKDKQKAIAHEELEDVGKSTPVLRNRQTPKKTKENRETDAMAFSCPPRLLRTRNIGNKLKQDGEINASKSWTDPRGKAKKKKCSRQQSVSEELRQQKAYFEELDAEELLVEEVSGYDSG